MNMLSDNELLAYLKAEDNSSFQLLYKQYFATIATYIKQNTGSQADAEDVFQEAMVVLLKKVRQTDFMLTSTLKTYLFAIAKNLWLKRLRNERQVSFDENIASVYEAQDAYIEVPPEESKEEKVQTWLSKITTNCQRILRAIFYLQEPMESLMQRMGWKNKRTAATQKYKCLEQVKKQQDK